jgi:DNA-binding NarL/FixJ family response regulator
VPCSVLVVDDDAAFRDLARRVVTDCGCVVIGEAASVAEALARAADLHPDTALVDIGLPDGDGFSLTEQLVAMAWPVRVVLTSTDADEANHRAAARAGAASFLPKEQLSGQALRPLLERG